MAVDRPLVFTVDALLRYPMSSRVIRVDCAKLSPFVAAPGDPGNGIPLSLFDHPLKVDIAYGGSCTAGKREDFDHYHEVPAWGLAHGLKVPPSGQLFLQYGTTAVRDYCIARGYDKVFEAAGARMLAAISAELQLDLQSKAVWWLGRRADRVRRENRFPVSSLAFFPKPAKCRSTLVWAHSS
jgi:hypothetical protein